MDRLRNEQMGNDFGEQSILEYIEERQLTWYGHLHQHVNENSHMTRI